MPDTDMTTDPLLADVPVCEGYKTLGGVVLYEKLGQGGMGAVYKGRHLRLDIDVAVKVMAPPTGVAQTAADNFIQRFVREAKTAASVKHQNLIRVMDVNTEAGVYYLVMDYIDGESAADRLKRKGVLSEAEALEICLGAAEGLSQAHAKGIVHRDVKPDNIMIDRDGGVVVADLGLAKAYGADEDDTGMGLSMSQQAMGTPYYMSPEQTRSARDVGPSADVWSLGVTLYQLLTNAVPWPVTDLAELIMRIRNEPAPEIAEACPGLSDRTREILAKTMNKDPSERYADCREMAAAVRTHLDAVRSSPGSALPDTEAGSTKMALVTVPAPPQNTLTLIAASMVGGVPAAGAAKAGLSAGGQAAGTGQAGIPLKVRGIVSLKEPGAAAVGLGVTPPTMAPRGVSTRTWAVMLAVGALILLAGAGIAALAYSHYAELERKADEEKEAWQTAREDARAKAAKWDYDGAIGKVDAFLAAAQLEKLLGEAEGLKKELLLAKADLEHDGTTWPEVRTAAERGASEEDYQAALAAVDGFLASARTERFRPEASDLRRDLAQRKAVREEARLQARLRKEARLREEQRKLEEARRAAREKVDTLLAAARTLREKGLLEEARDRLSEALAADPDHAEATRLLTQVQADIARKLASAERAAEYKKWMNEGLRLSVSGKLEEAARAYDQASQLAPARNLEAAEAAARCRHDRFRAEADKAGKAGYLAAAIKLYEKALSYKDDPDTRRALEEVRKAVQAEEERLAAADKWRAKAKEAEGRGDLRVALACYRKAAGYGADVAKKISLLEREVEFRDGLASARSLFVGGNWREARSVASEILSTGAEAPKTARTEASALLEEIEAEYGPWGPLVTIEFGSQVRNMELAYVKSGRFQMGSERGGGDERPVHEVAITRGFYIGRHEVTQTQYYVLTRADPSYFKGTDQPVEKVTWHDSVKYCARLSRFTGKVARLPTEAEWEYAARAGSAGEWCFVDEEGRKEGKLSHYAWYGGKTAFAKTHPVGQKKPNPWGLHDMYGNVGEWCSDWYDRKYYAKSPQEDPTGPAAGKTRVLRGGSFSNGARACRSATRESKKPDYSKLYVGFRVVIEAGNGR